LICPYCGSEQVRISTKEAYEGWQIGLPQLVRYKKGKRTTYSEAECIECGKNFRPEIGEAPSSKIKYELCGLLHKKLVIQTRKGIEIQAEVIADYVTVKVMTKTGCLAAYDQILVEMKDNVINIDSPLTVMESDTPVGIIWATGLTPQGHKMGIAQPITQSRMSTNARK